METFRRTPRAAIVGVLMAAHWRRFDGSRIALLRSWEQTVDLLQAALASLDNAQHAWLLLEYPMLRLGRRADAIMLTGHAVIVIAFKIGAVTFDSAAREQVEDYALDLQDFHAGCRRTPIVPVLVATEARAPIVTWPLWLGGVTTPVLDANSHSLAALLTELSHRARTCCEAFCAEAWQAAPYRPVPTIVQAACMLYSGHGAAGIRSARADTQNLTVTTETLLREIAGARAADARVIQFVTGIPGAGKTLCGLNVAFGGADQGRATFLTGNPALVHVLREALARDAIARGADRRAARQQMEYAIQELPKFRDHHVAGDEIPAERIIVVDEAQRCWSRAHAAAKTRDRAVQLTDSEPGHLLDIMARHEGFAAVICLVGSGQEIHNGEGGLAEWGAALRRRQGWRVRAPADTLNTQDKRQRLDDVAGLRPVPGLRLDVSVRQIRGQSAAAWVDAVLEGDDGQAAAIALAAGGVPFFVTRSLAHMRAWLKTNARGSRRCGLLASSGGRRLRAEGLGVELPHMDAQAVARWFLDRWPDVRASDALETVATEFSCQGLELDYVGLCWDGDLIRPPSGAAWRVRRFRGSIWTSPKGDETIANQINTYRVLMTRARYDTVIFVPQGSADDATRDPAVLDRIADFLTGCGAHAFDPPTATAPAVELQRLLV